MTVSTRKKGLGKGLSALLGDIHPNVGGHSENEGNRWANRNILPLAYLERNPDQPRKYFNEESLRELSQSIKDQGVLQPILVREVAHNRYQIVAGERRWRASQLAGLHEIPVIIQNLSDTQVLEIAIIENIQREDLSPIEEGRSYKKLVDDFGRKQDQIAEAVGKSRSHIANLMRLLTLPDAVQKMVDEKHISMGHARALLGAKNALLFAQKIISDGLSVRQVEALIAVEGGKQKREPRPGGMKRGDKDTDTLALEKDLSAAIGSRAIIEHKSNGSGTVTLHYDDLEKLDRLCSLLGVCGV